MSAPVFRASGPFEPGGAVVLDGAEGRHAATVLRLAPGAAIALVDGAGARAVGSVASAARASVTVDVHEVVWEPEPSLRLIVAQGLLKGEHWELAVDQLTQAGADAIVPWSAERSMVGHAALDRVSAKAAVRIAAAAKQARRARWPELADPASTTELVTRVADPRTTACVLLHEEAGEPIGALALPEAGELLLVVGPEGGIAPAERESLAAAGAVEARLGPTVLRGSLAGAVAAGVVLARTRWAGADPGAPT